MSLKHAVLRSLAEQDLFEIVDYYRGEAGTAVAVRFVEAYEAAIAAIVAYPAAGSARYGQALRIAGLRHHRVKNFPHLIFYIDLEDHVDVWRILHGASDIPEWLGSDEAESS